VSLPDLSAIPLPAASDRTVRDGLLKVVSAPWRCADSAAGRRKKQCPVAQHLEGCVRKDEQGNGGGEESGSSKRYDA